MAVIKHVEYKIVCDKCYTCLSDFEGKDYPLDTKQKIVRYLERKFKIKKGEHLCGECGPISH